MTRRGAATKQLLPSRRESSFYMPALVALLATTLIWALLSKFGVSRQARLQALIAVMPKLLHAWFALFRTNQPYDGSKLCLLSPIGNAVGACA
jgi:hypothetical protein